MYYNILEHTQKGTMDVTPWMEWFLGCLGRAIDSAHESKLTSSKYAKLATCSQDTAVRDILALVERGILVRGPEGGRSTSYALAEAPRPHHGASTILRRPAGGRRPLPPP